MESQPVIMLQIAGRGWTRPAVHVACQMAREIGATILLVKMVPVQHIAWLGTELGYMDFTRKEQAEMTEYQEILEEYDIDYRCHISQYVDLPDIIVQIVRKANAQIAFATLPTSIIPGWHKFQLRRLRQRLSRYHCELIDTTSFDAIGSVFILPPAGKDEWMEQVEALFDHRERV